MPSAAEQYARRQGLNVRDALIFLVDYRVPMLRRDDTIQIANDICPSSTPSLLSITLRCIADIMKTKIVSRNKDAVGVIAFGARGTHTRQGWPGVRVLRPLKQADAAAVKQMQGIARRLEDGEADSLLEMPSAQLASLDVDRGDLDFCFGPDTSVEFDKALWAVRHHFTAVAAGRGGVMHRKRVFVFTNDQDPSGGNRVVRQLSLTQAKDLAELGASLDVSLLMSPRQMGDTEGDESEMGGLDGGVFWNDLVYTEEGGSEADRGRVMISTVYSFDDMLMRVRKKDTNKRAIRKTVLVIGEDYNIGVAIYALVKRARKPVAVELDASTNKPVFRITTTTCEASGEVLKPDDVRHTFEPPFLKNAVQRRRRAAGDNDEDATAEKESPPLFGFKKSEIVQARALGRVGIVMYGFRSESALRKEYTLSAPQFLFPDDSQYTGSTKAFAALLKCMLLRKVVGIASVRLSEKFASGIRFAALVPQREVTDSDGEQIVAGGLQLYYLPYKDDIYTAWRKEIKREAKEEDEVAVKEEEIEASELNAEPESVSWARRMVRSMRISEYSPSLFLNPDMQRFYAGLEHAAGVESCYNPHDELLNPDTKALQTRGGHYASEVKRLEVGVDFDGEAVASEYGTKGNKRSAAAVENAVRRRTEKRRAQEDAARECDDSVYVRCVRDGTLGLLLRSDLVLYCKAHGLISSGTKAALMIRIEDHVEKQCGTSAGT
eukprot:GFKZ01015289.1.p1 GENE.GFKZ01015289.1~~GFKZ01015289.1.p1  ORF type:complete len:719 (+),score=108.54 GFKZ01015289.1:308-2464(+)